MDKNIEYRDRQPIPGFEGRYSATADGRIVSEKRTKKSTGGSVQLVKERILKPGKHKQGYLPVVLYGGDGTKKSYLTHRLVASAFGLIELSDPRQQIDHIDNNKSNNRLANLRKATNSENNANGGASVQINNKSGFMGVNWHKQSKKWMAGITKQRKPHYLGLFHCPREAARAYDEKAREFFGEFAFQNFPQGGQS